MANFEKFANISAADDWTLKNDIELKDALEMFSTNTVKCLKELEATSDNFERKMFEMELRLKHVHNRINCAKAERFIEERVDDIEIMTQRREPAKKGGKKEIPQKEYEERTIKAISAAALKGFEFLKIMNEQKLAPTETPSASTSSQMPYANLLSSICHQLPPIIGTKEFKIFMEKRQMAEQQQLKIKTANEMERASPALLSNKEEEDIESTSSNRSVPPQDPTIVTTTTADGGAMRDALLEEIVGKMAGTSLQKQSPPFPDMTNPTRRTATEASSNTKPMEKPSAIAEQPKQVPPPPKLPPSPIQSVHSISKPVFDEVKQKPVQPNTTSSIAQPKTTIPDPQAVRQKTPPKAAPSSLMAPKQKREIPPAPPTKAPLAEHTKISATTKRRTRTVRKSLFSSSSSEDDADEGGPMPAHHQGKPFGQRPKIQEVKKITAAAPQTEAQKGSGIGAILVDEPAEEAATVPVDESAECPAVDDDHDNNEEEMSAKPVFKQFDSAFSNQLAAALQNGPIALRADRPLTRRPLSAHSIGSSIGDDPVGMARPLRKTESSVSSNEELGPASVKTRIAQIGAKIPTSRGGGGRTAGEEEAGRTNEGREAEAPMPQQQSEALKSRAKGPAARRAPSQMMAGGGGPPQKEQQQELPPRPSQQPASPQLVSKMVEKPKPAAAAQPLSTGKAKAVPPLPPPKQNHRSIFSSSSSEDELMNRVNAPVKKETAAKTVPPPKKQPPLPAPKTAKKEEPAATQRKRLFDDTDSDF